MNTRQKLHQLHLNEWASHFADQSSSGLTIKQWCAQNNYSIHTYNYWKHILKEALVSQVLPDIVPLVVTEDVALHKSTMPVTPKPSDSSLTNRMIRSNLTTAALTIDGIAIQIDSDISEDFLRTIIKAVHYA